MFQPCRRFVTAFLLAALTAAPVLAQGPAAGASPQPPLAPMVKTVVAGQSGLERMRRFPGRIAARETVDLAFEVAGFWTISAPLARTRSARARFWRGWTLPRWSAPSSAPASA
jgi:hypothetical protein